MLRIYRIVYLLTLVGAFIVGCGAGGTGELQSQTPGPADVTVPVVEDFSELNLSFAPPSVLCAKIASVDDDWLRPGAAYLPELPHNNVSVEEASLRYAPVYSSDPPQSEQAYAFYAFDIVNHPLTTELKLIWGEQPAHYRCFIGLSKPAEDEWEWRVMPSNWTVSIADLGQYTSEEIPLTVGVVLTGAEEGLLDYVRLGFNATPVADLSATPDSGECPLEVLLDASGSTDSDGNIVRYDWDFDGDGKVDSRSYTTSTRSYTYSEAGEFNATVTVYDDAWDSDSASVLVTVEVSTNLPPYAELTAYPTLGAPPLHVEFDASGSTDDDGEIVCYDWDFDGNGTIDYQSTESNRASHIYNLAGEFHASVTVTDNRGASDIAEITVLVKLDDNDAPVAVIEADPTFGRRPLLVSFDASSSTDDGHIVMYEWDFNGDGVIDSFSDTNPTVEYTYSHQGTFNANLRVTDNEGAIGVDSIAIEVEYWEHSWGTGKNERIEDVIEDGVDSVYVCGKTGPDLGYADDALLIKYSTRGEFEWVRAFDTGRNDHLYGVEIDSSGHIWTAGKCSGTGNQYDLQDILLLKYSPDGELILRKAWTGPHRDACSRLLIDDEDNLYLIGYADGLDSAYCDYVVQKYDNTGDLLWTKVWGEDRSPEHVDGAYIKDNVITFSGATRFVTEEGDWLPRRTIILRIDLDGNLIWGKEYSSDIASMYGPGIFPGPGGSIIATGNVDYLDDTSWDMYIMWLDSSGNITRSKRWGGIDQDWGETCFVNDRNEIFVSGGSFSIALPSYSNRCDLLMKLDMNGQINQLYYARRGLERYRLLKAKPDEPVYMVGSSTNVPMPEWRTQYDKAAISYEDIVLNTLPRSEEFVDFTGTEYIPEGLSYVPEGIQDLGAGRTDALITTFY